MNTYQLGTISRSTIFKRIRQHLQFFVSNSNNTVTMRLGIPITILIFNASTQPMSIMRKASIHSTWMEQITERSEAR